MSDPIYYAQHPSAKPKSELEALANCYAFLIEAYLKREANEAEGGKESEGGDGEPHTG